MKFGQTKDIKIQVKPSRSGNKKDRILSLPLAKIVKLFLFCNFFLISSIVPVVSQEASGLSLGKPLESIRDPGEIYLAGTKGDWNVRCITGNPGEIDKCEIQQLIFLDENTPIADISLFKLPDGEMAVAAANVMVPLETLLTKNFRFAFSDNIVKEFQYSFCNKNGCLVRMGLLQEDIEAMKKGSYSQLSITHISSPEATINLSLSLDGFTAAFDTLRPF